MKRRILVVDDNADLAENLRELLELEGFDVQVFTSPVAALAMKDEVEFDAALLDIRMPEIDGIELCAALAPSHPKATFVLMTAFTSEARLADVAGSKARAILKKPLPLEQLLSLLGAMTSGTVLVVEDDETLRDSLAELLAPHGYRVHMAGSLAEARAALTGEPPDVALVDVRLPDGSGTELASELLAKRIDVVLTTAFGERGVRDKLDDLRSRGVRYLEKPFPPAVLLDMIAESARRTLDG